MEKQRRKRKRKRRKGMIETQAMEEGRGRASIRGQEEGMAGRKGTRSTNQVWKEGMRKEKRKKSKRKKRRKKMKGRKNRFTNRAR